MDQEARPVNRDDIINYDVRCIVAGSRAYNNEDEFNGLMDEFDLMLDLKYPGKTILYVTGKAKRGPDDMIIRRCIRLGKPWVEFPADWDELGKRAGFVRNADMAEIATDLIVFWDGKSAGSKHMYETGMKKRIQVMSVLVKLDEERIDGRKPKGL